MGKIISFSTHKEVSQVEEASSYQKLIEAANTFYSIKRLKEAIVCITYAIEALKVELDESKKK